MLRRHSSKGLDRRKSTSSAHSKYEAMDPEVARHHAHTAAVLAYNRARESNSADGGHRAGGQQRNNFSQDNQPSTQQTSIGAEFDRGVKRQQSVRFAGPNAVQRKQSIGSRANGPTLQQKSSTATLRPIAMTASAPVPAANRPPSRSSSIGKASCARTNAASFMAGDPLDEYYTREDDIASNPSSYRRVRKSKSMFSPLRAPNVFYTNGSPDRQESIHTRDRISFSRPQTSQATNSPIASRAPILRAPKSMSFLKGGRRRAQPDNNDEAVQLARDRFFHDTAQQRLREQPSFLFRSRAQNQEKPFRQSVRSSSGGYGAAIASAGQEQPIKNAGPSLREAARKASKTISKKFKKVFGRSKEDPISIPEQQVDARESHVREYNGDPQEDYSNIPHPDEASLSSVAARVPSIHAVNFSQRLRSYAGSVKSHTSDQSDDKSRVTSWTSAGGNTLASQRTQLPVDRSQRLSIINETGTHIPSSTFRRPSLDIRSHLPILPPSTLGNLPLQKQIDSARVYSALMKRLDENSPRHKLEASRKASRDNFHVPNFTPRSRKSIEVSPGSSRTPATIRHVTTGESVDGRSQRSISHDHEWIRADSISSAKAEKIFGHTGSHIHHWTTADPLREARMRDSDDVFSPQDPPQDSQVRDISSSSNKENMPPTEYQLDRTRSTVHTAALSRQPSTKTSYHSVPEISAFAPQEIAIREEPVIQDKKRLRDSRSAFFGGTSVTINRATSPYRRAMAEVEYESLGNELSPFTSPFARASMYLAPKQISEKNSTDEQNSERAYSDSIYSRTTSGCLGGSVLSLPLDDALAEFPLRTSNAGDAVIVDRSVYKPRQPSSGHRRGTGSTGSNEWKKWMSSEVSKLERTKENSVTSPYVNYALPTMRKASHPGHFREAAQIYDDDDAGYSKAPAAKQSLGVVQLPSPNIQNQLSLKPILKKASVLSLAENSEAKFSPRSSKIPVPPRQPPPPIPQRSPLRVMPSRSSLLSQHMVNTPNSTKLVAPTTLRSVTSANFTIRSVETPAKLVKRNGMSISNVNTPLSTQGNILDNHLEERFGNLTPLSKFRSPRDSHLIMSRENMRLGKASRDETRRDSDIYGVEGSGLLDPIMGVSRPGSEMGWQGSEAGRRGSTSIGKRASMAEEEGQVKGSRMMVDYFLSSRRKRIVTQSEESGAGGGDGEVSGLGSAIGGESPSVFI